MVSKNIIIGIFHLFSLTPLFYFVTTNGGGGQPQLEKSTNLLFFFFWNHAMQYYRTSCRCEGCYWQISWNLKNKALSYYGLIALKLKLYDTGNSKYLLPRERAVYFLVMESLQLNRVRTKIHWYKGVNNYASNAEYNRGSSRFS